MRYILLSEMAARRFGDELRSFGLEPIALAPDSRLNAIVARHADTLICELDEQRFINEEYAKSLPCEITERLNLVSDFPFGDYPNDTAFNALKIGRFVFARADSLSPLIKAAISDAHLELVGVNQGYAKCSTLALGQVGAAITADKGMESAMRQRGIATLLIESGSIALDGCEYGFIGGASFVVQPQNVCSVHQKPCVYFFGALEQHPNSAAIADFISSRGYDLISLGGELTDYGGAVVI